MGVSSTPVTLMVLVVVCTSSSCLLYRYSILTPETYPRWNGRVQDGIKHLMSAVHMESDQWQLGKSKVFVKSPESVSLPHPSSQGPLRSLLPSLPPLPPLSRCLVDFQLFLLEELRERKYDGFARIIQKAWRRHKSEQYFYELKKKGKLHTCMCAQ